MKKKREKKLSSTPFPLYFLNIFLNIVEGIARDLSLPMVEKSRFGYLQGPRTLRSQKAVSLKKSRLSISGRAVITWGTEFP